MAEFLPRAVSPKQAYLVSGHRKWESSATGFAKTQSVSMGPEVIQEPPQDAKTMVASEMSKVPEVITKPPQFDPTSS